MTMRIRDSDLVASPSQLQDARVTKAFPGASDRTDEMAFPAIAQCELSIVMPCLNEAETIGRCIAKANEWLASRGVTGEVVIGDNGSTDGSIEIARGLGARVVHVKSRGYGAALDGAIRASHGQLVIVGDSDDSYDFSSLDLFVERLREGWELVMRNRFKGGIRPGAMPWKNRYVGNPVLSWIGQTLFQIRERDFHCGIRGFTRDGYDRLNLATSGMEFASEMVIKARYYGLRTCEVPTVLWPDGRSRPPHLRPWRDGWRHLRFMFLFAPRWLFFYPGALLAATGAVLLAALLRGPIQVAGVSLDIHAMLFAALALIAGFESMTFGILGKTVAIRIGAHPVTPLSRWFEDHASTELVSALGIVMALAGGGVLGRAVVEWSRVGFGAYDPTHGMRLVIPGAALVMLGLQTILMALLLGVTRLPTRAQASETRTD